MKLLHLRTHLTVLATLLAAAVSLPAQVILTGTSYTENFDSMGNAAGSTSTPSGWSTTTDGTSSSLGTTSTSVNRTSWTNQFPGNFYNVASTDIGTGSSNPVQNAATDRALSFEIGSGSGTGNPGAGILFNVNTTGFQDFSYSFDLQTNFLDTNSYNFAFEYSVNAGASWVSIDSSIVPSASLGSTTVSGSISSGIDDLNDVYLRLRTPIPGTGVTSNNVYAIDNFSLNYAAVPEPTSTFLMASGLAGFLLLRRRR